MGGYDENVTALSEAVMKADTPEKNQALHVFGTPVVQCMSKLDIKMVSPYAFFKNYFPVTNTDYILINHYNTNYKCYLILCIFECNNLCVTIYGVFIEALNIEVHY